MYKLAIEDIYELELRKDEEYSEYVDNPNRVQIDMRTKPLDTTGHITLGKLIKIESSKPKYKKNKTNKK